MGEAYQGKSLGHVSLPIVSKQVQCARDLLMQIRPAFTGHSFDTNFYSMSFLNNKRQTKDHSGMSLNLDQRK